MLTQMLYILENSIIMKRNTKMKTPITLLFIVGLVTALSYSVVVAQIPAQTNTPTRVEKDPGSQYEAWIQVDAQGQWQGPSFDYGTQTYHFPFTAGVSGLDGSYSTDGGVSGSLTAGDPISGVVNTSSLPSQMTLTVNVDTGESPDAISRDEVITQIWGVIKDVASVFYSTFPGTINPATPKGGWPLTVDDATPNSPWDVIAVQSAVTPTIQGSYSYNVGIGVLSTIAPTATLATGVPSNLFVKNLNNGNRVLIQTLSTIAVDASSDTNFTTAMSKCPRTQEKNGATAAVMSSGQTFSGANGAVGEGSLFGPATWTTPTDHSQQINFNWFN